MNARLPRALAPLMILALSGCATSQQPVSYYTLMPDAPQAAASPDNRYAIEVMPVDVPMQVDVPQMVVSTGNGERVPVDTRRWIAPLPNELRNALSWQLTQALGVRDVAGFTPGKDVPVYRVSLRVQRFDSSPGAYARIDALWSIRPLNSEDQAAVCSSSATINAGAGYAALAQAHQQALARIAGEIAASLRAARSGNAAPACPAITN